MARVIDAVTEPVGCDRDVVPQGVALKAVSKQGRGASCQLAPSPRFAAEAGSFGYGTRY